MIERDVPAIVSAELWRAAQRTIQHIACSAAATPSVSTYSVTRSIAHMAA